jgi:hypothetical protein
MSQALAITLALLCLATSALGKETEPNPAGGPDAKDSEPHATSKPVTTTKIRRCPEGYELVYRVNGVERGCAKDIVPTNN